MWYNGTIRKEIAWTKTHAAAVHLGIPEIQINTVHYPTATTQVGRGLIIQYPLVDNLLGKTGTVA